MKSKTKWAEEEKSFLTENWGTLSVPVLAKRLDRTANSISTKAAQLKLGHSMDNTGKILLYSLLKELGIEGGNRVHKAKQLMAAGLKTYTKTVFKKPHIMVCIDDFWDFAKDNKCMFDFSCLEENSFGVEPKWVKVKRSEDFKKRTIVKLSNAQWKEAEDKELMRLLKRYQYTYPELSYLLNRTESAIQNRIRFLGIKERPLPCDCHADWTDEQVDVLFLMLKQGSNYENISQVIGKSVSAIRSKIYRIYSTANIIKISALLVQNTKNNS